MTNPFDIFDIQSEEKEFKQIPAGDYQVEIEQAQLDESGQYGPQLKYTLKITEETTFKNRKIWVNRKLSPETMWKIRADLNALGHAEVSSKNAASVLSTLPGRVVNINVTYNPNKNKPEKPYQNVSFKETVASDPEGIPF